MPKVKGIDDEPHLLLSCPAVNRQDIQGESSQNKDSKLNQVESVSARKHSSERRYACVLLHTNIHSFILVKTRIWM